MVYCFGTVLSIFMVFILLNLLQVSPQINHHLPQNFSRIPNHRNRILLSF